MDNTMSWYENLIKPSFAPPSSIFGVAWSILYPIIFISYGYTIYLVVKKEIPSLVLIPLGLNLLFNFLFSPIQFGLRNNFLAAVDIVLVITTLIWFMIVVFPYSKQISLVQIPYLLWGLFATILQFSITWLNR
jgi:benzodiazapine receptor